MKLDEDCEVCRQLSKTGNFEKRTDWYRDEDAFTVMRCETCSGVLVLFKSHMEPSNGVLAHSIAVAEEVVREKFPNIEFVVDPTRRKVPKHPHYHLRPRGEKNG